MMTRFFARWRRSVPPWTAAAVNLCCLVNLLAHHGNVVTAMFSASAVAVGIWSWRMRSALATPNPGPPRRPSLTLDVSDVTSALARAISACFEMSLDRVEVLSSVVGIEGTTPLVQLDVRVDGRPAPPEIIRFVNDIHDAAKKLEAERRRLVVST